MRKTKLIILPTKCLNQMGFLLLFLSCPVIGDWGRIRPESEMSQWSIQIEKEGSCGLVRDSPGIKDSITPDGLMECYAADAMLRNNTQLLTETTETSEEPKTDFISYPEIRIHESRIQRRNIRSSRIETDAERRVNNVRQESQERSFRRSIQARSERRAVSLDRQTSFRYDERRAQREVRTERSIRDGSDYRRLSRSLDRRVVTLERRDGNERVYDTARRLSLSRQVRGVHDRRDNVETARRRTENGRRMQEARSSPSRNEERRLTRQEERNNARRDAESRNVARRDRFDVESRRTLPERRMERREHREERRVGERRSLEERVTREASERRSIDRTEGRAGSPERRIRGSYTRERDIRTIRQNPATDRRVRNTETSRRRDDSERNVRSFTRSERRIMPENRRVENELSRKEEMRVSVRRVDKPEERRDFDGVSARMREEHREKSARVNYRMRYDRSTPLNEKNGRWETLHRLKTFLGKSSEQDWVSSHGDFATTCLVGAAIYFLTTRQVKSV